MTDHQKQTHPDEKVLADFGLGKLPKEDHESVELHVENCEVCCRLLETLPNDQLVTNIRQLPEHLYSPSKITPTSEVDSAESQPTQIGGYEIIEEIGRGGMGVVFKAKQTSPSRFVALKMLRDSILASKDEIDRFQQEADAIGKLQHPGIVSTFEVTPTRTRSK